MDAEFYFFLGALLMVVFFIYIGVHKKVALALDSRIQAVKDELGEAARLRGEAQALLDSFAAKKAEAEAQAEAIVAQAKAEAETMAKDAHQRLEDYVARRAKQAEDKIALAEAQALADVRASATDAAVKAAETVLKSAASGPGGAPYIEQGVASIKSLMN